MNTSVIASPVSVGQASRLSIEIGARQSHPFLSVIMPTLNEEKNISAAINNTLKAFEACKIDGEIIAVNDGSTDNTAGLIRSKMEQDQRVRVITHAKPEGIGASFWDGVREARSAAVTMLPGDNENEPTETLRYLKLLDDVDMVIPFVSNKEIRSLLRNLISSLYRFIINTSFGTSFKYTNGTVIYRKTILKDLTHRSAGFFFQTENLVKLAKAGYLFAEVPYRLGQRKSGASKALTLKSFWRVTRNYLQLLKDVYFNGPNP